MLETEPRNSWPYFGDETQVYSSTLDSRCSLMGYDLNRHWNQVSPWSHPTLNAVKNYLLDLDASKVSLLVKS